VLIQAGQSAAGIALGARYAEIVFTALSTLDDAREFTGTIRRQAAAHRRKPGLPLIFSSFHATFSATEAEAHRLVRERHEAIDYENGRALVADMLGGSVSRYIRRAAPHSGELACRKNRSTTGPVPRSRFRWIGPRSGSSRGTSGTRSPIETIRFQIALLSG
jgi:alkanesulfonate monooxygenase SsuD/methylene tetrahydromethanopterin reductase-like flavin-dependent oxidoreductase (luciferase family)